MQTSGRAASPAGGAGEKERGGDERRRPEFGFYAEQERERPEPLRRDVP